MGAPGGGKGGSRVTQVSSLLVHGFTTLVQDTIVVIILVRLSAVPVCELEPRRVGLWLMRGKGPSLNARVEVIWRGESEGRRRNSIRHKTRLPYFEKSWVICNRPRSNLSAHLVFALLIVPFPPPQSPTI